MRFLCAYNNKITCQCSPTFFSPIFYKWSATILNIYKLFHGTITLRPSEFRKTFTKSIEMCVFEKTKNLRFFDRNLATHQPTFIIILGKFQQFFFLTPKVLIIYWTWPHFSKMQKAAVIFILFQFFSCICKTNSWIETECSNSYWIIAVQKCNVMNILKCLTFGQKKCCISTECGWMWSTTLM